MSMSVDKYSTFNIELNFKQFLKTALSTNK